MPIHDWTRVAAGIFHAFHHAWVEDISRALNRGLLPSDYYAVPEQITGGLGPDIVALQRLEIPRRPRPESGGVALAEAPPKVAFSVSTDATRYAARANAIAIRHVSELRVVAMIEIVSPGNKNNQNGLNTFVGKAREGLAAEIHLLVVDLFPPSVQDPQGIHRAIWGPDENDRSQMSAESPLTCAAYVGGAGTQAYVQTVAVGGLLPDMPLFLSPDYYVPVPLEATYSTAFDSLAGFCRELLRTDPAE